MIACICRHFAAGSACRRALLPAAVGLLATSALAGDHMHPVAAGETLIGIGKALLHTPGDWPKVQRLNRIANPHRLRPGTVLSIPAELLRLEPVEARATSVHGDVRVDGQPLTTGRPVAGGAQLTSGSGGFATIELIDGSRLILQPSTRMRIEELSRQRQTGTTHSRFKLEAGRIESQVNKSGAPKPQYIVNTPTATLGVRGTSFRVSADVQGDASRTEVTEGTVAARGSGSGRETPVHEGYGLVAAGGRLSAPVPLLPAPDATGLPELQERTIVRLGLPAIAGATAYRFQVGPDAQLFDVLGEVLSDRPEAKFADLPDGRYLVRVRGVDGRGLEGRDADRRFTLKARPEPPFASAPIAGVKLRAEAVELSWTANPDAARYRVQLAADTRFASPLADIDGIAGTTVVPAKALAPGEYFWRLRSIRADGDAGPWGDPQRFVLKPLPADPEPPTVSDDAIGFAWSGEPGQRFLFQFSADPKFAGLITEQRLDASTTRLPRPSPGTYYARVQATDADGFVGPFTRPQTIAVPQPPPPWWLWLLLLLPAAL